MKKYHWKSALLLSLLLLIVISICGCLNRKHLARSVSIDLHVVLHGDTYKNRPEKPVVTLYLPIFTHKGRIPTNKMLEELDKENIETSITYNGDSPHKHSLEIVGTEYGPMIKFQSNDRFTGITSGINKSFDSRKIGMCPFLGVVERKRYIETRDVNEPLKMAETMIFADFIGDSMKLNYSFGFRGKKEVYFPALVFGHGVSSRLLGLMDIPYYTKKTKHTALQIKKKGWQKVTVFTIGNIIENKCEVEIK